MPGAKKVKDNKDESSKALVPSISDFSSTAIAKARKKYTLKHWTTRYSAVPLGLSVLGSFLFGFSELAFCSLVASFGLACFPWIYLYYIRAGNFEHRHVEELHKAIRKQTELKRECLKQDLIEYGCPDGAQQLDKLQAKFDSLNRLLADKLDPNELTYKRYQGIALEVFLSGIDNLAVIVSALKSISEIDSDHVNAQLTQLRKLPNKDDSEVQKRIGALETRLDVRQKQLDKIKRLLIENEQAMTQLDETTVAIADMDTGQNEAEVDMENSMRDLAEITKRAKHLSLITI